MFSDFFEIFDAAPSSRTRPLSLSTAPRPGKFAFFAGGNYFTLGSPPPHRARQHLPVKRNLVRKISTKKLWILPGVWLQYSPANAASPRTT